jgi:PAS domain S-box-containing protein
MDAVPANVWSTRPDGSVDFINLHWQEYTGLPRGDALGWGWEAAVHPDDRARFVSEWREALESARAMESEVRVRRAGGEYRWLLVRNVPVRDEAGAVLKWYGIGIDVDERKRVEQARERLHRLEADLAQISRVVTMGELTASLAHEINQPIAAAVTDAKTCLRWLARTEPRLQEARDAAARTVKDAARAAEIVNRVRQLFRRTPAEHEPLDLSEVVREIVALVRIEALRRGVTIRTDLDDGLPPVLGDRVHLQQVILSLILNGIEATRGVTGPREVTVVTRTDGGDHVLVSVADNGEGLPDVDPTQLFEAFFTTRAEGTGMGLAISRSIIETHSGRIRAAANEAGGATFVVMLPFVSPPDGAGGARPSPRSPKGR